MTTLRTVAAALAAATITVALVATSTGTLDASRSWGGPDGKPLASRSWGGPDGTTVR